LKLFWVPSDTFWHTAMLDAVGKAAMDVAPELIWEMTFLPARSYSGQGGEYSVFSEVCVPIAFGPWLGPLRCCRNVPRKEDKTADEVSSLQAASPSAALTRAAWQVDPHLRSTETHMPRSQTHKMAREQMDLRGNMAPHQPPHNAPQDW
jgi:hypothetical protein